MNRGVEAGVEPTAATGRWSVHVGLPRGAERIDLPDGGGVRRRTAAVPDDTRRMNAMVLTSVAGLPADILVDLVADGGYPRSDTRERLDVADRQVDALPTVTRCRPERRTPARTPARHPRTDYPRLVHVPEAADISRLAETQNVLIERRCNRRSARSRSVRNVLSPGCVQGLGRDADAPGPRSRMALPSNEEARGSPANCTAGTRHIEEEAPVGEPASQQIEAVGADALRGVDERHERPPAMGGLLAHDGHGRIEPEVIGAMRAEIAV